MKEPPNIKKDNSWIKEPKRTWAEWAALRVLLVGPIPKHVAFIMDGNRRFARQLQQDTLEGHSEGFKKLTEVLSWCRDLEIGEVTVYAFSIENFKRSKTEVDGLMRLAEDKFEQLLGEVDKLKEHGVRIRMIGRIEMLTTRLQRLIAKAQVETEGNLRCCLNLALAYTSRDEIGNSVSLLRQGVVDGELRESDLNESLLEKCLYTSGTKEPDLLIRTSGEVRLSDFLLWQSSFTHLFFANVLWPQISFWHVVTAVFHYQRHHHTLVQLRKEDQVRKSRKEDEQELENWAFEGRSNSFANYMTEKTKRKQEFLSSLKRKSNNCLIQLSTW